MKKFVLPCDFPNGRGTMEFYVENPRPSFHPLQFQMAWTSAHLKGHLPDTVRSSVEKLHELAIKKNVALDELMEYAIFGDKVLQPTGKEDKNAKVVSIRALAEAKRPKHVPKSVLPPGVISFERQNPVAVSYYVSEFCHEVIPGTLAIKQEARALLFGLLFLSNIYAGKANCYNKLIESIHADENLYNYCVMMDVVGGLLPMWVFNTLGAMITPTPTKERVLRRRLTIIAKGLAEWNSFKRKRSRYNPFDEAALKEYLGRCSVP